MPTGVSGKFVLGGALAAGALATVASFGLRPESQLFGRTLVAGTDPNEIALTYDDGPNDRSTPELLEVLNRFGVHATFFMIGKFVRQRPDVVRAVQAEGHLIGNHTLSHPFLANKSTRFIRDELQGCNAVLEDVLGAPVHYFRPPFGARRPAVLRCARDLGLTPVQWNVQGNDWEPIGTAAILRLLDRGLRNTQRKRRGANVLLHDGFDQQMGTDRSDTVRATEMLLWKAQEEGRRVVTVDAWG
ncbi:MAG: polysaccharide deacetylase family protein [Janthinobacterium lividum]